MASHAGLLDAVASWGIVVRGDEDDRYRQSLLELEAAHLVHVDVEHQTRRSVVGEPLEKFARGCERLDGVTRRPEQAMERATNGHVVVHDGDDGRVVHTES